MTERKERPSFAPLEPTEPVRSEDDSYRDYLLAHLRDHAYTRGRVTLASGKTSDFYIDCKKTILRVNMLRFAGRVMNRIIYNHFKPYSLQEQNVMAVAGTGVGGYPLAASVAIVSNYPHGPEKVGMDMVCVRSAKKDHGTKKLVEGAEHLPEGAGVVMVEDVTTTGGSVLGAAQALREAGLKVRLVVTLVDRLEGARENLAEAGIPLISIFTREDFVPSA
jgi:orotate phosphoribosyltransferase